MTLTNQIIIKLKNTQILTSLILVILLYISCFMLLNSWAAFTVSILFFYSLNLPRNIGSPRNILFGFYFAWYTFPVALGLRYSDINLYAPTTDQAYLLLFFTFTATFFLMTLVEQNNNNNNERALSLNTYSNQKSHKKALIDYIDFGLFTLVLIGLLSFIQKSGGIGFWIENGGRAFLLRKGSGAQYLFFILSLFCLAYKLSTKKTTQLKKITLSFVFVLFILSISLFIGSKAKLITILLLFFLPSFYDQRTLSIKTIMIVISGIALMILGNYFRNSSWMQLSDVVPYTLNYFDTFEALLKVLNTFEDQSIFSIHYPFNKVINLFDKNTYHFFDISAYLTSLFHPNAWSINATVQYPIEAQLYLSTPLALSMFIATLPGVIASIIYNLSMTLNYKSLIFVSFLVTLRLMAHYRGGVIYWTDLYMIPFFIIFILSEHYYKHYKNISLAKVLTSKQLKT